MNALDSATVALLRATSGLGALRRADADERRGVPAYDAVPRSVVNDPRAYLAECPVCGGPVCALHRRVYCSDRCKSAAFYRRNRAAGRIRNYEPRPEGSVRRAIGVLYDAAGNVRTDAKCCAECGLVQPVAAFTRTRSGFLNRHSCCRRCRAKVAALRYRANPERQRAANERYLAKRHGGPLELEALVAQARERVVA